MEVEFLKLRDILSKCDSPFQRKRKIDQIKWNSNRRSRHMRIPIQTLQGELSIPAVGSAKFLRWAGDALSSI